MVVWRDHYLQPQRVDSEIRNCVFDESVYKGFNLTGKWGLRLHIHDNVWRVSDDMPAGYNGFGLDYWFLEDSQVYNNRTNGALSLFANNRRIHDNKIEPLLGMRGEARE